MSNIYIQEPPTDGKVLLVTSAGDFDIELWSREAPKACRNFVQLCMEGYYDKTIFHRVVKGFIVQGGDPTGTGMEGESIYGKPFKDEIHSRLRFTRRGLVAMANAGKNDNSSQFFFTLGACNELKEKHTIFGKVVGDTVYNLSRFEEGSIGQDDHPEYPHKINRTEILKNPFADIVPRLKIENEILKEEIKKKGTKNFNLLSFGDEAEEDEEDFAKITKKLPQKGNSAHDIAADPTLSNVEDHSDPHLLERIKNKFKKASPEPEHLTEQLDEKKDDSLSLPVDDKTPEEGKKRNEIKAEIRKLKRELQGRKPEDETIKQEEPSAKRSKLLPAVQEYLDGKAKYESNKKELPKKGADRESRTLALLKSFTEKVKNIRDSENVFESSEDSWLGHRIIFDDGEPILAKDANLKDASWHDLNDPRHAHNKQRREESNKEKKRH